MTGGRGNVKHHKREGWEHAVSRYMSVTVELVDVLQRDFLDGRALGESVAPIDASEAAVIVAESLEADRLWNRLAGRTYLSGPRAFEEQGGRPKSDFRIAVEFELMIRMAEVARAIKDRGAERNWEELAMATLKQALRSATASPMLSYGEVFLDVAEAAAAADDPIEAQMWIKRALAHELRFAEGRNAVLLLTDLARISIEAGDVERGLQILAGLLRDDPGNIWAYSATAYLLDECGLPEISAEAARRGLALLDAEGDPEKLRGQMEMLLESATTGQRQGPGKTVAPAVLNELRAALQTDFGAEELRPVAALCREVVPDIDEMPVKRPLEPSDVPLPDREEILEELAGDSTRKPQQLPGRNAPCWCGSGKKYKHCHLREDQRGG